MSEEKYSSLWEDQTGVVKWFSRRKGYGFIELDEGGEDVFFHISAISGDSHLDLAVGHRVEFIIEATPDRIQATQVVRLIISCTHNYWRSLGMNL